MRAQGHKPTSPRPQASMRATSRHAADEDDNRGREEDEDEDEDEDDPSQDGPARAAALAAVFAEQLAGASDRLARVP